MAEDYVNHPSHYRWGSKECIEVIEDALTPEEYAGYLKGTEIKYIYRHEHKWDAEQDLEKCTWYLNRYKARFSKANATPHTSDLASAYLYELSNVDDAPTEKLIMEYIDAVKYRDTDLCEAILIHLRERISQNNIDSTGSDHADTDSEVERESQTTDISTDRKITDTAKQIMWGLKFLEGWDLGLWEHAYSFNYDDQANILTVETAIDLPVNGYSQPVAVTVKLSYDDVRNWSVAINTPE